MFFCSLREISRCRPVQQHKVDLASRAEGRHSQTAAIRMIVPSQMLFCVPSIPLWCSARLRRLATPLEWAEVLTLLLVLLPGAPQECFVLCTLKIWLGATTDAWKWIINCEDSTGLSKDTCFSGILVSWQVAIWAFAYHPAGSCLSWCKLLRDLLVWITSLLIIFFLLLNYPCLFSFICSLHFF